MKYLIDSSAWIEYLRGSKAGEKVYEILKEDNEIYTLSINIGEVISKVKRDNGQIEIAYNSLTSNVNILGITPEIAKEAGLLHAQLKEKINSISLADTFMIASAKAIYAKILTCDEHFKNFKEAIIIQN